MKNKNILYYGLGAIVLVAIIIFWSMGEKSDIEVVKDDEEVVNQQMIIPTEDKSKGSINAAKSTPSLSYAEALESYKDARIQLGDTCQASPSSMTFKNDSSVMIDNRAPVARTVKVGSEYPVKAYGFKIIKLSSSTLPVQWLVDCDKYENVASIIIQK